MKTLLTMMAATLLCGAAQAVTSDEIAAALGIDPSVGTFTTSGDAEWFVETTTNSHAGATCMRSGAIPANGSTWTTTKLTLTIDVKEPSRLSFWYRTSFYNSSNYSRFSVASDSFSANRYSEVWYQNTLVLLPGRRIISWEFARNWNSNQGSKCVWLDDVSLTPISTNQATAVGVSNITCHQRTPWNGKVDIDYTVTSDDPNADIWVYPVGYDRDSNTTMAPRALEGAGVNAPVKAGTHRMTWTVTDDYPNFNSTAFTVKMTALTGAAPYMVVDLSGGVDAISYPVTYLSAVPAGGWGNEYKGTKMAFRLIPPGSFWMGSPTDEPGRCSDEDLHGVVLTKPFYMGVFECTQKQYELVMGTKPSNYKGDYRPVEQVSYNDIRGSVNGAGWPTHNQVDANSFMGRLRSKANMLFDLPTEAEWEYACRAGTSTGLNSGKDYSESNVKEVARCNFNSGNSSQYKSDGKGGYPYHTTVGCYLANAWGLYDMLGNVWEICRDFTDGNLGFLGAVDPRGFSSAWQNHRISKGGSYSGEVRWCRSACRSFAGGPNDKGSHLGFRVMCSPVAQ
ncbi:MAG: formylglycine-generating enzyme family protein [Kiritimatiellia bacterium]